MKKNQNNQNKALFVSVPYGAFAVTLLASFTGIENPKCGTLFRSAYLFIVQINLKTRQFTVTLINDLL